MLRAATAASTSCQERLRRLISRSKKLVAAYRECVLTYVAKGILFVVVVLVFSVIGAAFPDGWGRRLVVIVAVITAWTVANVYGAKLRQLLKGERSQQE